MAGRPHRRSLSHHHRHPDDDVSEGTAPILQARQSLAQEEEVQAEHQRGRTAEVQREHQRSVHGVSELPAMSTLRLLCPQKRGHGETQP